MRHRILLVSGLLFGLGVLLGQAAAQEPPADAASLKKACDKNDASACHRLAGLHRKGEGVAKDLGKAASLYKKACDANFGNACVELASMHRAGEGQNKDM